MGLPMPEFTRTGLLARVQGQAVLRLALSGTGAVQCAWLIKDLPMGLGDAALKTALQWTFPPYAIGHMPAITTVAFHFALGEVAPPEPGVDD